MFKSRKFFLVIILALIVAFVSARYMAQGTPLVTIPWGILAVVLGLIVSSRKEALTLGACLGFVASYSYLWFDSSDLTLAKAAFLVVLIVLPSLFGLLGGLLAAWVGWAVRTLLKPKE